MESRICIIGCGGHARSVADVILNNNHASLILFIDENAKDDETLFSFPVVKHLGNVNGPLFVAIGDNKKREKLSKGRNLISVISCKADVSPTAIIEEGCFIGAGAHIGPFAHIGRGTIINTNAIVEHEVNVGAFCHIAPNATVCGRTSIGNNVFAGAGSIIIDKLNICSNVIIGAGAAVVKDIEKPGIYAGIPASLKKESMF